MYREKNKSVTRLFIFSPVNYLVCLANKHSVIKPEAIKVSASLANQVSSPRDVTRQQGGGKNGGNQYKIFFYVFMYSRKYFF